MTNPFVISMRFEGDAADLKAASAEARKDVTSVATAAEQAAAKLDHHTNALERETRATREAASAAKDLAAAEASARGRALQAQGVAPASRTLPASLSGFGAADSSVTAGNAAFVAATRTQEAAVRGLGAEVERTRQESANYRAELDAIRARYNPLFAASQRYEQELRDIAAAEKLGAISAVEAAQARATAAAAMAPATRLSRAHAGSMKLQAHEAQNLTYQLNDVFQSILLGMPPQQILLQQGPQITQIYGGVGKTFKALTRALTPMRIGLGLTAGSVVALGAAYNSYLQSTKEVEVASRGVGLAMTTSSAELQASARAGAAAAGISISAARELQAQFLRTGKIGGENFDELIGLSKDFATTLGIEAEAAGEALAEMFSDPAKAAEELYRQYGLIDGATARRARNLAAQNRLAEAQAVLLEALPARLVEASDATTLLGRAWQSVATGASNAFEWIGATLDRAIDGPSLDEQIEAARALVERTRGKNERQLSRHGLPPFAEAEAALAELEARAARLTEAQERRAAEQRGAAALVIADESGVNETAAKREQLQNELEALRAGQSAPGLDQEQQDRIAKAIDATTAALQALNSKRAREAELDRIAIQLSTEKNPLTRAELEARKRLLDLASEEVTDAERSYQAERARQRVIEETIASARLKASEIRTETEIRAKLAAQVANGNITQAEANRLLQEELELRPLVAAAAQAEGAEKARLQEVITALRDAYAAAAVLQRQVDQGSTVRDYLRSQEEKLQKLRLEAALLGRSEAVRARELALLEAEQKIFELRLDREGSLADKIRDRAAAVAEETRLLQRQVDAWADVQSAGESAIDNVVDALLDGEFDSALDSLATSITDTFADLAIKNPLKNSIFGTDYGTLADIGGIQGILGRISGKEAAASPLQRLSAGTMQVTAATVVVNGALAGAAANFNMAPGGLGGGDVSQQIWQFFQGKGLAPHQIAGVLGNVAVESGFDPGAIGDGGTSFGLFQHHAGRGAGLLSSIGGMGNLGDVQAQLEYVWKELLSSESGVLKRLLSSTDVEGATNAFLGFERPSGWSMGSPEGSAGWAQRMQAAQQAMSQFALTTNTATDQLGTLGSGFGELGQALASAVSGGQAQDGGGGFFSALINGVAGAIGIPGFREGGETGGSDASRVAGVVHEKEFVFDAVATARIGPKNLEALRRGSLRGFQSGGYVSSLSAPAQSPQGQQSISPGGQGGPWPVVIHNYGNEPIEAEPQTDSKGQPQLTMTVGRQAAAAVAQRGNPLRRTMQSEYGLKPVTRNRG